MTNVKVLNEIVTKSDALIKKVKEANYGQELILDVHGVDVSRIHSRSIKAYAKGLCNAIGMVKGPIYTWGAEKELGEYPSKPKFDGISCVQFLHSSSITIHALDEIGKVFVNIFSCNNFSSEKAKKFTLEHFGGNIVSQHNIIRK